ncbi:MAG TPA: histone deacetylase [Candidatus Eremiobacteraceae bacterium]|nr:histone deacetylase [Candidatus Eremiobacteraceae bacterium]
MLKVLYDPGFARHRTGAGHPERPERLEALAAGLEAGGCPRDTFIRPRYATADEIASVHEPAYIALVEHTCASLAGDEIAELPTRDTVVCRESFDVALLAAGAALAAGEAAAGGSPSFALARPPGHHAEPGRGMGFCVFNNVAIAAQAARRTRGSTLVLDFDYHHGNGTQAWAQNAIGDGGPPLGFLSTHAFPAYPGTGAFRESLMTDGGFIIDIPLGHTTDTTDFIATWASLAGPLAAQLEPAAVLVSAGFDFLAGDPIAGLPVGIDAVDALCALIGSIAQTHGASLAFILEGGYATENLRGAGERLARSFGSESGRVAVPVAARPNDIRLQRMIDDVHGWLR